MNFSLHLLKNKALTHEYRQYIELFCEGKIADFNLLFGFSVPFTKTLSFQNDW